MHKYKNPLPDEGAATVSNKHLTCQRLQAIQRDVKPQVPFPLGNQSATSARPHKRSQKHQQIKMQKDTGDAAITTDERRKEKTSMLTEDHFQAAFDMIKRLLTRDAQILGHYIPLTQPNVELS